MTVMPVKEVESMLDIFPFDDTDNGDSNYKAHIVEAEQNPHIHKPGMTGQDVVDIARAMQMEVTAICGHKWIPKRNPEKFDLCQKCIDIFMNSDG